MTGGRSTVRSILAVAFCVALLAGGACSRQQQDPAAAFPATNDVAGWTRTSNVRTCEAAELWKYIDGEAEKYLKAGVQRVSTADYKFQSATEAVVDIYAMSNADGATQIFTSEPAGDAKSVRVGDAARLFSQSLVFRKGRYLVRIVAYQESPDIAQELLALGQGIEPRLGQ